MADIKSQANPLFLREDELRQGIELLFYAYRDFTAEADAVLQAFGFGRAHHRVIYFVGRNPGMPVSALLDILKITKQSLSRVLGQLLRQGFVQQRPGTDRRQRLLDLTPQGAELERRLTERLEPILAAAAELPNAFSQYADRLADPAQGPIGLWLTRLAISFLLAVALALLLPHLLIALRRRLPRRANIGSRMITAFLGD